MDLNNNDTPIIKQWKDIKSNYENELIFFRLGDFYELFFEDAKVAARLLNITLTKKKSKNAEVPMAGIPYHAATEYINKLLSFGESIVICEQDNNNIDKESKLINRKVEKILTPSTVIEEDFLSNKIFNFLSCFYLDFRSNKGGVCNIDISTGYFEIEEFNINEINDIISRINPTEIIFEYINKDNILKILNESFLTKYKIQFCNVKSDFEEAKNNLVYHFDIYSLNSFGLQEYNNAIIAASFVLNYCKEKQNNSLSNIRKITHYKNKEHLYLDNSTRKSLEINKTIDGEFNNSLIEIMNFSITKMGFRKLNFWLNNPLQNKQDIKNRFDAVEEFQHLILDQFEQKLNGIQDVERIINRVSLLYSTPKEILNLNLFLKNNYYFNSFLKNLKSKLFKNKELYDIQSIIDLIDRSIMDNCGHNYSEGFFIKDNFDNDLDYYRKLMDNSSEDILDIEDKERILSKNTNLKISYNKLTGYFIEISKNKMKNYTIPKHFIFKQSLKNAERYTTNALIDLENKMLSAKSKVIELEKKIFNDIQNKISIFVDKINYNINIISDLEVIYSYSKAAKEYNLIKPIISNSIQIKNGRHIVIEKILNEKNNIQFTPNDLIINDKKTFIITGANMGGKSTYMRQNAIILLLAHSGSFVPAESCSFKIIDKIFTRIGASDNISNGLSTFMVEMTETANIINNATKNSFVLLDEVGRGTSTYDGLALAKSIIDYISNNINCYTLFSTHYFEISKLEESNNNIENIHLEIEYDKEKESLLFNHKVKKGSTNNSYGIEVAKIAGIPNDIIHEAKNNLNLIINKNDNLLINDIIDNIDCNNITPKEALDLIYKMKEIKFKGDK